MMIALEARAPALKRLRSWSLAANQDPFGRRQVVVTFGRIGAAAGARHAFEDEAGLSSFVRHALLRHRSPTRRIGVSYEAVQASPSVLPVLAQLGLAIRPPPAPEPRGGPQSRQPQHRQRSAHAPRRCRLDPDLRWAFWRSVAGTQRMVTLYWTTC